jgi:hypothetical protein
MSFLGHEDQAGWLGFRLILYLSKTINNILLFLAHQNGNFLGLGYPEPGDVCGLFARWRTACDSIHRVSAKISIFFVLSLFKYFETEHLKKNDEQLKPKSYEQLMVKTFGFKKNIKQATDSSVSNSF